MNVYATVLCYDILGRLGLLLTNTLTLPNPLIQLTGWPHHKWSLHHHLLQDLPKVTSVPSVPPKTAAQVGCVAWTHRQQMQQKTPIVASWTSPWCVSVSGVSVSIQLWGFGWTKTWDHSRLRVYTGNGGQWSVNTQTEDIILHCHWCVNCVQSGVCTARCTALHTKNNLHIIYIMGKLHLAGGVLQF